MALIEYDIQYDESTESSKVICVVLAVGGPDKICFKSNDPKTAIQFKEGTPFDPRDSTAPQLNELFLVEKKTKEFDVVTSGDNKLHFHFDCGEAVPAEESSHAYAGSEGGGGAATYPTQKKTRPTLIFKAWKGSGGGTPPPDI
jgi:hypothetical protein